MSGYKKRKGRKKKNNFLPIIVILVISLMVFAGVVLYGQDLIEKIGGVANSGNNNGGVVYLPKETQNGGTETDINSSTQGSEEETGSQEMPSMDKTSQDETTEETMELSTEETTEETTEEVTQVQSTEQQTQEVTQAQSTGQQTQEATGKPMSKYEIHNGKWDLATLDNTQKGFGYAESNRAENMVPTDWEYYENKWGMYNVDWIQDINSNTIYLTMDVGFPNDYTEGIMDVLKQKNVKVVFFITKMFLDGSPDTVQRMIDEGHIIGNHTCNHFDMPSIGIERETSEIMDLWNAVHDKFGYDMKLFRFPEGQFSDQSLALVENLGFKSVFWSYAYNDFATVQPDVKESYEKAVSYLHPGAIYLLHASSSTNAAFLGDFIDAAREKGYEFGTYPLEAN